MVRILLYALILLLVPPAMAENRTLRVGYLDFPPYLYRNDAGEADGIFVNLTRQVAAEAGYQLEFQFLPAARAYQYLETGRIDLWQGFVDDPTLKDLVLESMARPINVEYGVWYLHDTPEPLRFTDFHGTLMITITGYNYAGMAQYLAQSSDIQSVNTPSHRSALDMLERGHGDFLLDYRDPVEEELLVKPVPSIRFTPLWVREAGWLFSRAAGNAEQRVQDFDAAWQRLRERGEIFPPEPPENVVPLEGMPLMGLWSAD